jgi:hypothetical protein
MPIKFTTLYMPTKDGKWVARCQECPKCYKVGKIVGHSPFAKNLDIIRICLNKECVNEGQEYPRCHQSWDEYSIPELEEYKKWLEENWGSLQKKGESIRTLERGLKYVNEVLERKKKKREENRVK